RSHVGVRVGQLRRVDDHLRLDQGDAPAQVPAPVDGHGPNDTAILQREGYEAAALEVTADHGVRPVGHVACGLDVGVVLVGPEPVDLVVGVGAAQHRLGGGGALLQGVLPVLHPDVAADEGVQTVGHVAGCVDTFDAGTAVLVHDDAILEVRARGLQQ